MKPNPLLQYLVRDICMSLLFVMVLGMALFPAHCAHAREITLKYGQCIRTGRDRYCAPARNICPAQKPCPTQAPCICPDKVCPPCPTQQPCPQPSPCPLLTNDGYWYAIASMFLACDSDGTNWNLPAGDYVAKLKGLSLGAPTLEVKTGGCYLRYWNNALVILNPQESISCTIPVDGRYKDLDTGATVRGSVTVQPKKGKILTK